MADNLTPQARIRAMRAVKSTGTSLELRVLKFFRKHGIKGWRRNQLMREKPDFVFPEVRVVVFVDGCFWHGCPTCAKRPSTNRNYWDRKIARNRVRDRTIARALKREGW